MRTNTGQLHYTMSWSFLGLDKADLNGEVTILVGIISYFTEIICDYP